MFTQEVTERNTLFDLTENRGKMAEMNQSAEEINSETTNESGAKTLIFVFKTSVRNKKQVKAISEQIQEIQGILTWNFDLTDCDKILRIEANKPVAQQIEQKLHSLLYACEELL